MTNKTVMATYKDRIAPVFDVAEQGLILETDGNGEIFIEPLRFAAGPVECRIRQLEELGAGTLLCGAISRFARELAEIRSIQVYGFLSGATEDIRKAWVEGRLDTLEYRMPGCGRGRCRGRCRGHGKEGGYYAGRRQNGA